MMMKCTRLRWPRHFLRTIRCISTFSRCPHRSSDGSDDDSENSKRDDGDDSEEVPLKGFAVKSKSNGVVLLNQVTIKYTEGSFQLTLYSVGVLIFCFLHHIVYLVSPLSSQRI